jgi:hypothetical protein
MTRIDPRHLSKSVASFLAIWIGGGEKGSSKTAVDAYWKERLSPKMKEMMPK